MNIIRAMVACFALLMASHVHAIDIYTITQSEVQQALSARLPLSGKTRLNGTATLHEDTTIAFKANGTVQIAGSFTADTGFSSAKMEGWFQATSNLSYQNNAIYLTRLKLDTFAAEVIGPTSSNKVKDALTRFGNKAVDKLLNKDSDIRDVIALLIFNKLEERPIYKLDGRKPWHIMAKNVLTEDSFIISKGLLTIRIP
jgi:hypothetical protein